MKRSYSLAELAQLVDAEVFGNPQHEIRALATLQGASSTDLSFIANPAYKKYLPLSQAGAVLIRSDMVSDFPGNKLVVANPYTAYARLSAVFNFVRKPFAGVHSSAVVGQDCSLGNNISIAANAVIGDGVTLADGVIVGAGCYIGDDTQIGTRTRLAANVSIYHGITIGADCVLHSGCTIGADGFGFAPEKGGWVKIHQLGGVIIGNGVEIGACTCIDRGALDNTVIDDGVIIDNLVQVGHNARIGKSTAIAGNTAIAGSTNIGNHCTIGGATAIAGHLTIVDNVHIAGLSMVSGSISEAGSYSGIPLTSTKEWRKNAARFRQLDALASRLIKLERDSNAQ